MPLYGSCSNEMKAEIGGGGHIAEVLPIYH